MPIKTMDKDGHRISTLPPKIVCLTNRDIRNKIYASRRLTRSLDLKKFSVLNSSHIFINENLTQIRQRQFWKTKQQAKNMKWKYFWTNNRNIFITKDDETEVFFH